MKKYKLKIAVDNNGTFTENYIVYDKENVPGFLKKKGWLPMEEEKPKLKAKQRHKFKEYKKLKGKIKKIYIAENIEEE